MPDRAPLRVLVADDERPARQRLEDLLTDEADVELVAACASGREAVDAIRTHDLDLALLDIQMPGLSGLDVVQEVGPRQMPVVIFVTAYDQHALEDRARHQIRLESVDRLRGKLLDLLEASPAHDVPSDASAPPSGDTTDYIQRIPVQTNREVRIVPVEEVAYFQSDGPYIEIHTVDDSTHLIRERMKTLDARLDPKQFCRIHRSTIVNLGEVESVQPNYHDRYVVRLSTAERLDVSRRRRDAFEDRFGLSF